jgi:hypothetical protein
VPTVLQVRGFRFFFFSNEADEPAHIHVERAGAYAKFWLQPVALVTHVGFTPAELRRIRRILRPHVDDILEAWDEHKRHHGQPGWGPRPAGD